MYELKNELLLDTFKDIISSKYLMFFLNPSSFMANVLISFLLELTSVFRVFNSFCNLLRVFELFILLRKDNTLF